MRVGFPGSVILAISCCGLVFPETVLAFSGVSRPKLITNTRYGPLTSLCSTEGGSESQQESEEVPPPPAMPASPPPVPQKRLDPLLASLTRMDPATANAPTKTVPLFGEIPVDGSLTVLLPAAGIAVLGFIFSIVVAVNSSDELVQVISQVPEKIERQAAEQSNKVYDPNVCRGLCSSQEQDLEGLSNFMNSLRR